MVSIKRLDVPLVAAILSSPTPTECGTYNTTILTSPVPNQIIVTILSNQVSISAPISSDLTTSTVAFRIENNLSTVTSFESTVSITVTECVLTSIVA